MSISRLFRLGRESFWIASGQIAAAIGSVVGIRVLTQVLPPSAYGELALGMTLATLALYIVFNPLSNACLRFYAPAHETLELKEYFLAIRKILNQSTVVLICICLLLCLGLYLTNYAHWLWLVIMSFIYTLLFGYSSVLDGVQNAARRRLVVAWHNGSAAWLRFTAAFCLVAYYGISSHIAMAGFALASALILVSQLYFFYQNFLKTTPLRSTMKQVDCQKWTRQVISYAWPFASWGPFLWGLSVADRWALGIFYDTETVGLYTALFQLGYYPMVFLFLVVSQVATPILFGRSGDGRDPDKIDEAHYLNNYLTFGFLAITVGLFFFSFTFNDQLFSLVVANQYQEVADFLPWMILAGGLFFTGQNTSQLFMIGVNTWLLALPLTTTSILGIILIFAGAYFWGLPGVVYARVAVSAIHLLCILLLAKASLNKFQKNTMPQNLQ